MPDHDPSWNTRSSQRRRGGRILVVERDADSSKLSHIAAVPLLERARQPLEHVRPEQKRALAAGEHRLRDAHARAVGDGVEPDVDLRVVDEAAEREPATGLPGRDPAELERIFPVFVVDLQHAPAHAGLDPHRDRTGGIEEVDRAAHPPSVDLLGERGEGAERVYAHLDGRGGGRLRHDCSCSST
jgi:hypothetical protein